jgi:hypothetical protein
VRSPAIVATAVLIAVVLIQMTKTIRQTTTRAVHLFGPVGSALSSLIATRVSLQCHKRFLILRLGRAVANVSSVSRTFDAFPFAEAEHSEALQRMVKDTIDLDASQGGIGCRCL